MMFAMDFKSDWHEILKSIMSSRWGMDVAGLSEDIPVFFFNGLHRRIQPRARIVHVADTFECPKDLEAGWEKIRANVKDGEDITVYLSKFITEAERTDAMLNDWGIHHFHLGATMKKGWAKRTGRLLFARVMPDDFYAIGIYDHDSWVDDEIVETLHRNWPETIAQWRMRGVSGEALTQKQREALRGKNANAFFLTSDGTTYGPIGGGVVVSGHNVRAVMEMDRFHDFLERLEDRLTENSAEIEPYLSQRGYRAGDEVAVKLKLVDGYYAASFSGYDLLVHLYPRKVGEGGV